LQTYTKALIEQCGQVCKELGLQAHEGFVNKVVQYQVMKK